MMDAPDSLPPSGDPAARPQPPLPVPGERLGVWRVVAPLVECASGYWFRVGHGLAAGQEAMALVYRFEGDAQAVLMRFAEDSEALARFSHPGYGAPLDSGLSPAGLPYLVVPLLDGGVPLLRGMELPLKRRLQWLLDLVALLDAAHAHGLRLHELDPGMLWLGPTHQLHWLGQGLAPQGSAAPQALVRAAEALAHAQQRAGGPPDAATEAHALGRLLGLLVNGRLPRAEGRAEAAGPGGEPGGTPVASLASWLSLSGAQRDSLDSLLDQALGGGFNDPGELAQAVRDWMAGHPVASGPMPLMPPLPPSPAPSSSSPATGPAPLSSPPPLPERSDPTLGGDLASRVASAALVLAAALAAGWWLLK